MGPETKGINEDLADDRELGSANMPSLEQHFLSNREPFLSALEGIDLKGRKVLELGAGDGRLSEIILQKGASELLAFELDRGLCRVSDPRLRLREEDFTAAELDYINDPAWCIISAPPYSTLEWLRNRITCWETADVAILVPEKRVKEFEGFRVAGWMAGTDFEPPSQGRHAIIVKGFARQN